MSTVACHDVASISGADALRLSAQFADSGFDPVDAMSPDGLLEYVRELELQKIEFELRTEELEKARAIANDLAVRSNQFYDTAPLAFFLTDPTGLIFQATAAGASLLGVERAGAVHNSLLSFVVVEDRQPLRDFLKRTYENPTKQTCQFRIVKGDRIVHILAEGLLDQQSVSPDRAVCLVMVDITEYAKAEQMLQERETLYRSLIDNIDLGILLIDADYTIVAANPAICRMSGLRMDDIIGKKCHDVFVHQSHLCSYCPGTRAMWSRQVSHVETPRRRADGTEFICMIKAIPMMGPNDQIVGFIEVVHDVTEQRRVEGQLREFAAVVAAKNEALQERTAALEAATHAKDDFLASMSHELRTPLNAIIGFSDGLLERADIHPLNPHQLDRIGRIKENGQFLLTLINSVLDLSKIEAGKTQINMTQWEVGDLVQDLAGVAEGMLKGRTGVKFALDVEEGLPPIVSDRGKLRQIVVSLLSNAAKFTAQGTITLGIRRQGQTLMVRVEDTGTGISEQYLHHVFDKFFQVPGATTQPLKGSGLGLSLCKAYAELLGGNIFAQSVEGHGSRFTVALPLACDQAGELAAAETDGGQGPVAIPFHDVQVAKVMCVEPDTANMLLWTDYLVDAGYQVVQIADGAEVLSQAIHEEPQAILLDLALPHADGWEVLNLLKSHPVTRDIPVIIVTSLDEEPGAVALGAADYLRKPVNRPHLLESLQQVFIGANRRSGWGGRPRDPETPARLENEGPHVQGAGDNPEKCGS